MGGCILINLLRVKTINNIYIKGIMLISPGVDKEIHSLSLFQRILIYVINICAPNFIILSLNQDPDDELSLKKITVRYIFELAKYMKIAANTKL